MYVLADSCTPLTLLKEIQKFNGERRKTGKQTTIRSQVSPEVGPVYRVLTTISHRVTKDGEHTYLPLTPVVSTEEPLVTNRNILIVVVVADSVV